MSSRSSEETSNVSERSDETFQVSERTDVWKYLLGLEGPTSDELLAIQNENRELEEIEDEE